MIKFLLLSILIFPSSFALAFPSNIRFGYNSCGACHVAVTGGSLLTPYGRMSSSEIMSTWGSKKEAELLNGLVSTSDVLDIGGDFQHVSISSDTYERSFVMQQEIQAGVNYRRQFYLVLGSGLYGEEPEGSEMRKYYLQASAFERWTLKLGRFFPAFGIMSNEHLYIYRNRYFDQGRETYNAELIFRGKYFEAIASKIFGHPDDFKDGVLIGRHGFSSRLSILPIKTLNVGLSYYILIDKDSKIEQTSAAHVLWAISKEIWIESQAGFEDAYFRLGFSPMKGLLLRPTVEYIYGSIEPARTEFNVQWLPRPHLDFQLTYSKTTLVFLSHYYL